MRELAFGFSPCPNDTFAFHALVHGLVDAPFQVRPVLLDIEELNRRAHDGDLELTKLSFGAPVELRFDRILEAVASGGVDAGLIIHESRFTYGDHGLVSVADLGELWEARTSLPVPLAGIFARRDLDEELRAAAERAIRASAEHAFAHPEASREYVRAHSQELS